MTFKEAYEHYRVGVASEEERLLVEEELEKTQLIGELLEQQWEEKPVVEGSPAQELGKVRKGLRRRSAVTVLVSLLVTAVVMLAIVFVAVPLLEGQYWDGTWRKLGGQHFSDLEAMLAVYTELVSPEVNVASVSAVKSGYATYDLSIRYWNRYQGGNTIFAAARLEKSELQLPTGFVQTIPINIFVDMYKGRPYSGYEQDLAVEQRYRQWLEELPEYVTVVAAVSFERDISMEEVLELQDSLENGAVQWVGVRNAREDVQMLPLCGFVPYPYGSVRMELNRSYPCLDLTVEVTTAETMRTHFTSMLQFLEDQYEAGTGIKELGRGGVYDLPASSYYNQVLSYVEDNGVYSYGCMISGSPKTLLALMDQENIVQVWPQDIWLPVG